MLTLTTTACISFLQSGRGKAELTPAPRAHAIRLRRGEHCAPASPSGGRTRLSRLEPHDHRAGGAFDAHLDLPPATSSLARTKCRRARNRPARVAGGGRRRTRRKLMSRTPSPGSQSSRTSAIAARPTRRDVTTPRPTATRAVGAARPRPQAAERPVSSSRTQWPRTLARPSRTGRTVPRRRRSAA